LRNLGGFVGAGFTTMTRSGSGKSLRIPPKRMQSETSTNSLFSVWEGPLCTRNGKVKDSFHVV
jgi:hypothetical protein